MTTRMSILLIEDDDVDVMNVRRALAKNNVAHTLFVASDGAEALNMLGGEQALNPLPQIVLLDLNLPRMNGIEFLRELRLDPRLKSLVAIVLTTSDEEREINAAFELNVAGYFVKPIGFEKFVEMMSVIFAFCSGSKLPALRRVEHDENRGHSG